MDENEVLREMVYQSVILFVKFAFSVILL